MPAQNNGTRKLLYWLLGAVLTALFSVTGVLWSTTTGDIDENSQRIDTLENCYNQDQRTTLLRLKGLNDSLSAVCQDVKEIKLMLEEINDKID